MWRFCRSAGRFGSAGPLAPSNDLGFRVSLVLPDKAAERAKTESQISNHKFPISPPPASPAANPQSPIPPLATSPFIGPDGKWKLPPGAPPPAVAPFDATKAKEHQAAWAKHLGVPVEITNSIGMKLVLIPPGEFMMGSPKELIEEELRDRAMRVVHVLSAERGATAPGADHPAVLLGDVFGDAGGIPAGHGHEPQRVLGHRQEERRCRRSGHEAFPVETVSWDDAVEFCRRLSEMPEEKSAGRRVPAAIGGTVGICVPCGEHGPVRFQFGRQPTERVRRERDFRLRWFGAILAG